MSATQAAPAAYSPDIAAALAAGVITEAVAVRLTALEDGITRYRAVVDRATAGVTEKEKSQ